MSRFRLLPLGTGDAFSATRYSASVLLEADDTCVIIDCPHPLRKIVREATARAGSPFGVDRIGAIALTHLHADHSAGIESFTFFSLSQLGKKVQILAHPEVSARLWDGHLAAGMERLLLARDAPFKAMRFDDYFEYTPLTYDAPAVFGPFAIECRRTIHHLPTTAFRIRACGRTLGYSADTAHDTELIEWLSAADLILHETGHGLHTPYDALAGLPAKLRARMRLIHFPDAFDVATSVIPPIEEGRWVDV